MFSYLNNKREVGYASTIAQLHYHEHTQQPGLSTLTPCLRDMFFFFASPPSPPLPCRPRDDRDAPGAGRDGGHDCDRARLSDGRALLLAYQGSRQSTRVRQEGDVPVGRGPSLYRQVAGAQGKLMLARGHRVFEYPFPLR